MKIYRRFDNKDYDPWHTSKMKKWITHHYNVLHKKRESITRYSDFSKYNMKITCKRKGFLVMIRLHDSEPAVCKNQSKIGIRICNRVWTNSHTFRKPTVSFFRKGGRTVICIPCRWKVLKYKLGSRFLYRGMR